MRDVETDNRCRAEGDGDEGGDCGAAIALRGVFCMSRCSAAVGFGDSRWMSGIGGCDDCNRVRDTAH